MRRSLLAVLLVLACCTPDLLAQRDSMRNDFINAESWFLYEEYAEAEAIYQKLLGYQPDNDNLRYKIGVCLLNDPYRKSESIPYLEDASKNINPLYKEGSLKETAAPPDVLYYLGKAYLVNNRLEKAEATLKRFKSSMDTQIYDEELVQAQIESCNTARRLMSMPVDIDLSPVSQEVNTRYAETHPVVSFDGKRMAFITKQPFFDEALFIEQLEEGWTLPMSLTSMLGFDEDIYPVALNADGSEMLLYYEADHIGNLYHSRYEDGFWSLAEVMGSNISTKFWESHGCFSKDGKELYFTSNRKGSNGGLDIWVSQRQGDGSWGEPENLGTKINSRYNEESPYISEDGNTLFFSSYGHYNMGGYDVFYSKKDKNGNWSEPVNMGYPINTTDDDLRFHPVENGKAGLMSRIGEDSRGRHDLYYITIYSDNNPRMYTVSGVVRTSDGETDLATLQLSVIDPENGDTILYEVPIDTDGEFRMELAQGSYMLHFNAEGYEPGITPLEITPKSNKTGITLAGVELLPVVREPMVYDGEESKIKVDQTEFSAEAGKPLVIPLTLEKGSTLYVTQHHDDEVVDRDSLKVKKESTNLKVVPLMGENLFVLEMTDSIGDLHRRYIKVTGTEHVPTKRELRQMEREARKTGIPTALAGTPVAVLLLDLRDEAESEELQDYLDALDLGEEDIDSPRELFEKLYEEAEAGNLDINEVDRLLADEISGGDVNTLHKLLLLNASGPLKDYLEQLDPEAEGINSVDDLLRHLEEAGPENGFTMDDVRLAMLAALAASPAEQLRRQMLEEADEGALKAHLESLDTKEEELYSRDDLMERLYADAPDAGYTKADVDELLALVLAKELAGDDAQKLHQMLLENADGPLLTYLEQLDLEAEGIDSVDELMEHLAAAGAANGFSMEDVLHALQSAGDHPMEVALLYQELLDNAGPELKRLLEGIDLDKEGILTAEDLIDALYQAMLDAAYSKKEIREQLMELFPGHEAYIDGLLGEKAGRSAGIPIAIILGGALLLILILILLRRRRSDKE